MDVDSGEQDQVRLVLCNGGQAPALHTPYLMGGLRVIWRITGGGRWSPTHGPAVFEVAAKKRRSFARLWLLAFSVATPCHGATRYDERALAINIEHRQSQEKHDDEPVWRLYWLARRAIWICHFLAVDSKVNTAALGLWGSAGLKMPLHAHFWMVLGILTSKVGQADLLSGVRSGFFSRSAHRPLISGPSNSVIYLGHSKNVSWWWWWWSKITNLCVQRLRFVPSWWTQYLIFVFWPL